MVLGSGGGKGKRIEYLLPLLASRLKNLLRSNSIWNASLHSQAANQLPALGFPGVFPRVFRDAGQDGVFRGG